MKGGGLRAVIFGRLAFCSVGCLNAALEHDPKDPDIRTVSVSSTVAAALVCYGCGLYLDELEVGS